jgi:tight adherence protein B
MRHSTRLIAAILLAWIGGSLPGAPANAQGQPEQPDVVVAQLEVILAIDTSASMLPAIEAAKAAATEFVVAMPVDVPIGVETFADSVTVLTPPTTDRDLIIQQIASIVTGGDTALYDVVVAASGHFTPTTEHKVIVLLSDGKDEGSAATLDDAVLASQGVQIEAISLTGTETDLTSLMTLGAVTSADDAAGVSTAFARVAGLIVEVIETIPSTTSTTTTTTVVSTTSTTPPATTAAVPITISASPPAPPPAASVVDASPSSIALWLGAAGVFIGLFLMGVLLFPRDHVSKARLGTAKPQRASEMGTRTTSAIEDALDRHARTADLGTTLAVADISMKPANFVAMIALVAIVAGLVGLLLGGPLVALLLSVAVCLAVRFYVRSAKARRQTAFAEQLPDVLQLVTTALRSGYGITHAIESVAEEAEEPARSEFAQVLLQVRLGRDLSDSMRDLASRMDSKDLDWVVSAIDINRETGGNLSEILHTVSTTIRERGRVARQVRTLTAEGRLSARILTGLPLVMLFWQWRVNSDNLALLTQGAGLIALVFAGILMALGTFWVRKIVNSVTL